MLIINLIYHIIREKHEIGIFGGTFNPPHKMHLKIALLLIEKNYVDKVIFVPTGNKYDRKDLNNEIDRLNMVNLMIKDYKSLESSDYELGKERVYTYQTLNYFKELYKTMKYISYVEVII